MDFIERSVKLNRGRMKPNKKTYEKLKKVTRMDSMTGLYVTAYTTELHAGF